MNLKITIILLVVTGITTSAYMSDLGRYTESDTPATHTHEEADHRELPHEMVKGELSGFDCAVVGVLCPTTHRGADYTTGVFTKDETFYFVVNIPQSFLQQYFRKTVEVEGTVYNPYNHAVEPETIHIIEGDERRLVYESGYFIDEDDQRATFQDGVFRNGRWIVPD